MSLSAFLRDYAKFNYSDDEIVDRYIPWVKEDKYMILTRWNEEKWTNDVFAVKCSKRGNDVYKSRVLRRFSGLCKQAGDVIFFNRKNREKKTTKALFVTLTYDTKRCTFQNASANICCWIEI